MTPAELREVQLGVLVATFAATGPAGLTLGSPRTQAGWPMPYAKLSDDRTVLHEPFEVPVAMGVNVDVFPLDPGPPGPLHRRLQSVLLRRLVPTRVLVEAASLSAQWSGRRPAERLGVRLGYSDWSVPASSLGVPVDIAFEGLRCPAPADPDAVLRAKYGGYRSLPPESERVSHHAFTASWRS